MIKYEQLDEFIPFFKTMLAEDVVQWRGGNKSPDGKVGVGEGLRVYSDCTKKTIPLATKYHSKRQSVRVPFGVPFAYLWRLGKVPAQNNGTSTLVHYCRFFHSMQP